MPEVSAALAANDLSPGHAIVCVFFSLDALVINGFVEAGPTGTGIVLRIRVEQFIPTCCAFVYTRVFCLTVLPGKRSLRSFHSADFVLLGREYFFPLLVGFLNFVLHGPIVLQSVEAPPFAGRRRGFAETE